MATNFTVTDHWVTQFTGNVELLLQQHHSRLQDAVDQKSYTGEKAQVVKQFGEVGMSVIESGTAAGQWRGDTVLDEIEHFNRWVIGIDHKVALASAKQEEMRQLNDPKSLYAEACRAAYARTLDDIIIAAATNDAKTGRYDDLIDTPLPDEQIVDYDYVFEGAAASSGLTVDKLIKAKEILMAAQNDPNEPRYLACSERQLSDLLRDPKVQSADYNTVRALVAGQVDTFMGFNFISTERLLMTAAADPAPQIRHCFAWVKSGLHLGTWTGLETFIDRLPTKNQLWQIYMRATMGATRTQEKKVVQVNCAE